MLRSELHYSDDSYSQQISDLSFVARHCCLVNPVLGNEEFIFKSHSEITKTQLPIQAEIQSLQKNKKQNKTKQKL